MSLVRSGGFNFYLRGPNWSASGAANCYAGRNKTVVFGMLERNGTLRAGPIPDANRATIVPIVLTNVQRGSRISTDEANAYKTLSADGPNNHASANHHAKEH